MIEEAYVSFEIAKLLKEKGFDECIFEFYEGNKIKYARNGKGFRLSELDSDIYYPHITLQMAMKQLREVYDVHINVIYNDRYAYPYEFHIIKQHYASKSDMNRYTTYEECAEKAIKFCLEYLIK